MHEVGLPQGAARRTGASGAQLNRLWRACGEYAGNRGVLHDVPSSMLEHRGHGAIVEVTQTTVRCEDDDVT